ncbi:phage scaffolding protein [Clostridium sp. WILCCON 0269]|uniref:Phage scaffolding protein n=1 Tax=Candidatus Clostridium eludens TaxID=3381663 RepID=A0ABW8SNP2_9CLOT
MPKLSEILGDSFSQIPEDLQKKYKDIDLVDSKNYVEKSKFDQASNQAKEYKKQVGERDKQISDLKEQYKNVDGLEAKVTELEAANKTQKETLEKQLADTIFNNALEKSLGTYSVKDKKLVMALIDKDKLKVDGDNIIGLKEQIEPLQKSHEYLFEKQINGTSSFDTGGGDPKPGDVTNFATELGKRKAEALKGKGLMDFAK